MLLSVIGTSSIVEEHLKAALKNGFKLHSISTTRKFETESLKKIYKKFRFKEKYSNWKNMYNDTKKIKTMKYLICPRIQDTFKISYFLLKNKEIIFAEKPLSLNLKSFEKIEKYKEQIFIGYNRVYYNNINTLKSKNFSNLLININCVEQNKKSFIANSCHIVSIMNKNHIFCK